MEIHVDGQDHETSLEVTQPDGEAREAPHGLRIGLSPAHGAEPEAELEAGG
jgi:hypothetical protein